MITTPAAVLGAAARSAGGRGGAARLALSAASTSTAMRPPFSLGVRPPLSALRFASSSLREAAANSGTSSSAFGETPAARAWWLARAAAASAVVGVSLSAVLLTDERLDAASQAAAAALAAAGVQAPSFLQAHAFSTADDGLHAPHYPWDFRKWWTSYDHAALRRGYQVYREICAACHSLKFIHWRNLVGVTHTEEEAKAMAAEYEYQDGPNDVGEYFMRPGKLSDAMPRPYPNEEAARAANAGANPPDLSCIVRARHGEEDYIYALLTGYCDPPAGATVREGLHYNPYFPGGAIGMARSIYDEVVDYEDGTPNNGSQIAKDVVNFLSWASFPEHDERKKFGIKAIALTSVILGFAIWWKRFKWSYIKSRKFVYKPPKIHNV